MICWTSILDEHIYGRVTMKFVTKLNSPVRHSSVHAIPKVEFRKKFIGANWVAGIWLSNIINFHMSYKNCKYELKICCFAFNFERRT
jgi:hypothetical protein